MALNWAAKDWDSWKSGTVKKRIPKKKKAKVKVAPKISKKERRRRHQDQHRRDRAALFARIGGDYKKYIRSPWWKKRRLQHLEREPNCILCGTDKGLQVHHIRYTYKGQSVLFCERDEDLRTGCGRCHRKAHYYKMEAIFTVEGDEFRKMHYEFSKLPVPSRHRPSDDVTFSAPEVDLPWDVPIETTT
jgi:hypothetical protein